MTVWFILLVYHNYDSEVEKDETIKKLNLEIKLYFFGVVLFMIGLIIPLPTQFKTIIYMIAILISGFHVMWEGLSDTVTNSLSRKNFYQIHTF